jgi:hypothetical protein
MIAFIVHAVLAASSFCIIVAEPGCDLVASPVEEAAVIGVVVPGAELSVAVIEALVGPSGTLVARPVTRVKTIIGHAVFSLQK